ncbi:CapA family protein, partial [Ruminococcaceae bacterium OttesenSCG-928-I18]|nr:CapA family protein [Ruminococcaceae bacterium OttesenSCG-928-I18]
MADVRICAVGDNLLHDLVLDACAVPGGYSFDNIYAPVAPLLRGAALAAVTQVTVFVPDAAEYSGFPLFGTPPAAGDALVTAGFSAIAGATNHMLDKGPGALRYTIDYWRENHPDTLLLGVHTTREEAGGPTIAELGGTRVALFNYTSMLNFHLRPPSAHYLIDLLKPRYRDRIRRNLQIARKDNDFVIVFVRWGSEYHYVPNDVQRGWAALFAECGVDVVIGQGTHVLQPLEVQKRPDGGEMTVFYSLGNFFSGQRELPRLLG